MEGTAAVTPDYYEKLALTKGASDDEIKREGAGNP